MDKHWPLWQKFLEYISKREKKSISRDEWRMIFSFIEKHPKDLSAYDPEACWPSIIDDFVEFVKSLEPKKVEEKKRR